MKIELKKGYAEEKYTFTAEDDVVLIDLKKGIGGKDCYPLYPVAIFTDNNSEIKRIELLWPEKSWNRSFIALPEVAGQNRLCITEIGEVRMKAGDDLSFQDDEVDVFLTRILTSS